MPETPSILIVDDIPDKLVALESILVDRRVNIVKARSGKEALGRLLAEDFAVVLLDVRMPGMDGFETATLIRERSKTAHTPIIFITAFGDETHVARGYSLKAVDYILTPVVPDVLRTKVSVFVELFRATAEVKRQADSLRQRAAQLHRLADSSLAINSALSLDAMLSVLTASARESTPFSETREANRLKEEFLSMVSHELRTPLSAMLSWLWMLRRKALDPEAAARAIEAVDRNAKAQARLVDDLLDVSRIMTGKLQLNCRPLELGPVVEAATDSFTAAAEAKAITLARFIDPATGRVLADPERLQQVIWNLLSNAIKFTPRGGRVEVHLRRVDSDVEVRVSDTGQGIAPGFLPYVFERFRQADASSKRTSGGLGLGLAIVRHLVELHGGNVAALSAGEGRGATIVVSLPLTTRHEEQLPAPGSAAVVEATRPAEAPCGLDGIRVLVVEDETDTREALSAIVSHAGAIVAAV